MTVWSYHVTYAFQSESTLYSSLNVKELLAQNRREWLSVRFQTKWLWVRVPLQLLKEYIYLTIDILHTMIYCVVKAIYK